MDLETAEALQAAARMIDNVNDRSMLNQVSLDLSVFVAAALRRQGLLNALETEMIERVFNGAEQDWPDGKAPKARQVLELSRRVWDAAKPL